MTPAVRLIVFGILLGCGAPCVGQTLPRVRIEFQVRDSEYVQAFDATERRQLEDSASTILAQAFQRNIGFVAFTTNTSDTTSRVLLVTLDQEDLGHSARLGDVGLHIELQDPPRRRYHQYWITFRKKGEDLGPAAESVNNFLAELRNQLDLLDADWDRLTSQVSRISIADSGTVTVIGPPTGFLIPYRAEDLCLDTRTSRMRIQNLELTGTGSEDLDVIARTARFHAPAAALARYDGHIHAKPIDPAGAPPANSLHVQGVFFAEYHFDDSRCQPPAPPSGPTP